MGSHVAEHVLARGNEVVVLDDLSGGYADNVPAGAAFVEGSINDQELLSELFAEHRFDYVCHLAAYAAEGLSHFIRRFNYENNLVGSVNLINESVKHSVKCFVFTSSIAVYGKAQLPMTEDTTPVPEDPYGISKYAVELDLAAANKQFGLPYIIFRPHNVYGERQNIGDKYRNVIGIFMNQLLKGEKLTIFGDGKQTRAFSYIDDVAPIIAGSVDQGEAYGKVFNVGGDVATSVNELAQLVMAAMGAEGEIAHLRARNEVLHAYAAHERVAQYFDTSKPTTLEDGIAKMAKWAKQAGSRATRPFGEIEIPDGLPEGW